MSRFDEIWPRLSRFLAFWIGTSIMVYETVADKSDRPWLYAAAVGMMGLPIARAAEQVLGRISGTEAPVELPEKDSPPPSRPEHPEHQERREPER